MACTPKLFLTLCMLATLALIASAENHPTRHDTIQEEKPSKKDESIDPKDYRLPKSIVPNNYKLELKDIDFETFTFNGISTIKADVKESVKEIILNVGKNMTIILATVSEDLKDVPVTEKIPNNKTETYKIILERALKVDSSIIIEFKYQGLLRDDMVGFYRSSYYNETGGQRWLAATQFESTHARHAFPCFDEPEFKATFDIKITVPDNSYNCLSNMNYEYNSNTRQCQFQTSQKMSTYLVAFVISDFKSYPSTDDAYLKMWARPNALKQAIYGQKIGVAALRELGALLDENYNNTMKKMDMVALPDFDAGAMENWGLITYRETASLYDEEHSADISQQRVASVIVHECTHMWFGNLVTPEWWSYLWLSEAFARYYQYMGTDMVEKDWKMYEQFIVEQFQTAMAVDSDEDSKPMTRPEKDMVTPTQIGTAGGTITYNKGASIVRMMEKTLGKEAFEKALKLYIQTRKFKSAKPEDLWEALQKFIGQELEIATIMKTWTEEAGYPYITVTSVESDRIRIKQEQFLLQHTNEVEKKTWWVPITVSSSSNPSESTIPDFWLSAEEGESKKVNQTDDWFVLNVQSAGFYRVNYGKYWNQIIELLTNGDFKKIHVVNRASIVDDLFNLARAGIIDYDLVFRGVQYLKKEQHYLPFKTAFTGFDYLTRVTADSSDYDFFKDYVMSLIENIYKELTFNDDKPEDDRLTILLRQELNNRACGFNNESCVKQSRDYFNNWKNNIKPVPKNQRSVVYCTAIKHGQSDDWEFLYKQYRETNIATEEVTILSALGCSQDPEKLKKYLKDALSGFEQSRIRKQDITSVFNGIYTASLKNAEFMIDFANENHQDLFKYENNYEMVGSIINGALKRYPIKRLMDKVEKIYKENATHIQPNSASIKKSLDFVRHEINLFNEYLPLAIDSFKASDPSKVNTTAYRLLGNVVPSTYDIHLTPHISSKENFTFDGKVKIIANVIRITKNITLHMDQLSDYKVKVSDVNGNKELKYKELGRREKYHFTDIVMEEAIMPNTTISIEIEYKGTLNTEMKGFYRSSYKIKKETRWLAATHLEPTGARRVFPCFDEPALKANFSISVQAPKDYSVISNTKLKAENDGLYKFETTPPMSTYLVAVIVSDFHHISDKSDAKHEYSVFANPLVIQQANYSLNVMGPVTRWFEDKLKHDYSLDKMDMIALPDFSSGAMENWGLLTYRETNLLYDPQRMSSLANKQSIRNVIAHEITHQWFGDLVSPHWWDYLWLNEGFARYFQCHAYTQDEAAWNLETQFVVDHLQTSFSTDGTTGTHPITSAVYSPTEIRSIFDKISYAKAASIIRMLEKLTGTKIFYAALNRYLEARKFDAAKPEDLFKAFQTEVDKSTNKFDVTELMNSWTTQSGFPVLNVKFGDDDSATINQTRFYQRSKNGSDSTWILPISWATQSNPNFNTTQNVTFIKDKQQSIKIKRAKDDWVILNLQQIGYFRVNYDENMWNLIIKALKSPEERKKIHEVNRANIIDDLLHLGRAGQVPYDLVFSGLSYLANETEYAPWKAAFTGLAYLNRRFDGHQDVYKSYKEFLFGLLERFRRDYERKSRYDYSHTEILLHNLASNWLCNFDYQPCVDKAIDLFKREKANPEDIIPPNKHSYVYCTAIKKGNEEDWNHLWQKFVKSDYATEKKTALNALTCSQDTKLLNRLMDETIKEGSEIRLQDAKTVFTNIVDNGLVGVETVLDYIQNNYKKMKDYLGDDSIAKSTLTTISKRVSTAALLKKFEDLVNDSETKMPELTQSLKKNLKRAKEEMTWYQEYTPKIFKSLKTSSKELETEKPKKSDYRLPTFAKPENYEIFLETYFAEKNFTFEGEVHIDVKLEAEQSHIVLHSHDLDIKEITVDGNEKPWIYNFETQQLTIFFEQFLKKDATLKLKIKYDGKLRDDMRGFYRSYYVDENNVTKWIASTHFEPAYARRAFPCFDEPLFKAYFTLHITIPEGYHALSNRGSNPKTEVVGKRIKNTFEKSLKMSPYLLAFVVSDFVSTPDKSNKIDTNRVHVWSRPQLKQYMEYAPPKGEEALKFLENFTQINYPLEEMNLASIPDFDAGAMENWGLVTFREYGLTFDEELTSAVYKRYVSTVISHELAHMWFGNWVTCEWWDFTWLNEGFATYFEYLISDKSEPGWQLLNKQFIVRELHVGLNTDSAESSHPMNNEVFTPTEAQDGFDQIAYQKSGSILRMLHHSFGDKVFVEGIRSYLQERKYNVGRPEYLYAALEDSMKKEDKKPGDLETNVTEVMKSWTEKAGYPVVKAVRENDKVTLTQERFLIASKNATLINKSYWVPITYTTESEKNFDNLEPKLWLSSEAKNISVPSSDKWYLINVQEIGFYRVNYDQENWQALIDLLNSDEYTTIVEVNRAQIMDDSFNLARAGYIKYDLAFNASKYLERETNYLPWSAYFSATAYISQRLGSHLEMKELYTKHVLRIIDKVYKKLGFKENMKQDDHLDQLTRELITTSACKYGHEDCVKEAQSYYSDKSRTITPNIAQTIYCTAVEQGDGKVWDEVWNQYLNALLATDYLTILRGLGCSKDSSVLEKYLQLIVEPESKIRRQDAGTAFSSIYTASQIGLNTSIEFFINNIDKLYKFYGDWHEVGALLSGMAGRISNDDHIKILEKLESDPKAKEIKESVESAIKLAKKNSEWFSKNKNDILTWLTINYGDNPTTQPSTPDTEPTTLAPQTTTPGSASLQV